MSRQNLDNWHFIEYDGRWYIKYNPWYLPDIGFLFNAMLKRHEDKLNWVRSSAREVSSYSNIYSFPSKERAIKYLKKYLSESHNKKTKITASEVMEDNNSSSENLIDI